VNPLLLALSVATAAPVGFATPNPKLTPGAVYTAATKDDVCQKGYTAKVRHVTTRTKKIVFARYGVPYHPSGYEVDHLISLELGGSNAVENLWPQPLDQARFKDVVETCLHRWVCAGRMSLKDAQEVIASDWYSVYMECRGKAKRRSEAH